MIDWDKEPQIVDIKSEPEPSLRAILLEYYIYHMTLEEAVECVNEYIEAHEKETK